jgi:hypothetical protein
VTRAGHDLDSFKQLFGAQCRSDRDSRYGCLGAGVAKPVGRPGRDDHRLSGASHDGVAAEKAKTKPNSTGNDSELLLLEQMGVRRRNVTTRRQKEIE